MDRARLIAAAPDLLSAARQMLRSLAEDGPYNTKRVDAKQQLRNAVKKATPDDA
jgi:hypothetical protein